MDFIKQWTFCVCITLIVALVLTAFSPDGRLKGFYKTIASVFIFISFLYPFNSLDIKDFRLPDYDIATDYKSAENGIYGNMVEGKIKSVLDENGIKGAVVSSDIDVDENEISINDVQIAISGEYDISSVKKIVFDNLGINARVIYNGE